MTHSRFKGTQNETRLDYSSNRMAFGIEFSLWTVFAQRN